MKTPLLLSLLLTLQLASLRALAATQTDEDYFKEEWSKNQPLDEEELPTFFEARPNWDAYCVMSGTTKMSNFEPFVDKNALTGDVHGSVQFAYQPTGRHGFLLTLNAQMMLGATPLRVLSTPDPEAIACSRGKDDFKCTDLSTKSVRRRDAVMTPEFLKSKAYEPDKSENNTPSFSIVRLSDNVLLASVEASATGTITEKHVYGWVETPRSTEYPISVLCELTLPK